MNQLTQKFFGLALMAMASQAQAQISQHLDFSSWGLYQRIVAQLGDAQIAVLDVDLANLPGKHFLMKNSAILGQIQFIDDVRAGLATITIYDTANQVLFSAIEKRSVCRDDESIGECRQVTIVTQAQPALNGSPALAVRFGPDYDVPFFYRYGRKEAYYLWREAFDVCLSWVVDTVRSNPDRLYPTAASKVQEAYLALISDPNISPIVKWLTISISADQALVITGRVPSYSIYQRVMDRLFDAGFTSINPKFIIDGTM